MSRPIDRRTLLRRATVAIFAGIGAVFGGSAIAFFIPSKQSDASRDWVPLGSTKSVELGEPTLFKASIESTTGWKTTAEDVGVYIKTADGRDYIGMSNICTHLGCRVRWVRAQRQFFCPCHAGVYDEDGNVVSGPPPRPLDRYEVEVDGEKIEFRP